jgi:DNA-binding CsgD family transcriptional regulator
VATKEMTMVNSVKNTRIPTKWFNSILKSLNSIENSAQLIEIVIDIKVQFGFNSISYGFVIPNNFRSDDYYIYSDDSDEWKQTYIKKQYWKIDTRIIMARKQIVPFHWSNLSHRADFISREIMKGSCDRMTIPVHGPHHFFGFLHFTYCSEQKKVASWLQYIQPFIICLAQHITAAKASLIRKGLLSPLYNSFKHKSITLTVQQRKCLVWVAEGKSTEEIALILNISVSTVNKHLDSASKSLNTNSRAHAVAKVIDGNLIGLEYKKNSNIFYF